MINVDDRLIRNELRKIGVDAFSILMCITTHLGKSSTAWPGVARLREMTGLSKERTYTAINRLIDSGMVERWQENEKGVWGKVAYRVTTQYLNIYVSASKFALSEEPLAGNPEHGYPEHGKPETGNPAHISINNKEVLISKEVINKEEERENAPAKIENNEPLFVTCRDHIAGQLKGDYANLLRGARERSGYRGKMTEIIEDYCRNIAEGKIEGKGDFHLMPPKKEDEHWKWLNRMLAGIERYMKHAARRQAENAPTIKAPKPVPPSTPTRRASADAARKIAGL